MSSSIGNNNSQTESTTINHTDTQNSESLEFKYGNTANKGIDSYKSQAQNKEGEVVNDNEPSTLLFFNYHEYMVKNYTSLETGVSDFHDQALVVTHFPSYMTPSQASADIEPKRIVRIPRVFTIKGIVSPEYSICLPGKESAAIKSEDSEDEIKGFVPKGIYEGEVFGVTSESPLNNYFSDEEFETLMQSINYKIRDCYRSSHLWNILEFILDMLTFWLLSNFFKFQSKKLLEDLEQFIQEINQNELSKKGIRIISPRRTAYLSIDFEIPKPTL